MKKDKWKTFLTYYKRLNVEPVIVLVYFGYVFGNTVQSPEIYRKICQTYYGNDEWVNCHTIQDTAVEDRVQQKSAEWSLYNSLSYLVPAIFADTLLGLLVSEFGYMLTLSHTANTPYWSTTVIGVFTGFTGYVAMIPVSCYAYLADISSDSNDLTLRSGIFFVLQTTASVLGGLLAGLIHDRIGIATAIDIELTFIALGFLYTLFRIPQKPGLQEIERRNRVPTITSQSSVKQTKSFLGEVATLYKECLQTYRKNRVGHRRAFMFITVIVLMLTYTTQVETRTTGIGSIINNFVFRRTDRGSLDWNSEDLGYWNGMGYLMLIIGTLSGMFVFKKWLAFRETTLILIGVASSTLRTIIIGVAVNDWMMYLANVLGLFAGLVQPAVVSFMTQIVTSAEIGRTFALFGIGADAAFIITAALYTNEPWLPGFTFLLIAFLQCLAFLAMLWVHFTAKKEKIGVLQPRLSIRQAIANLGRSEPPPEVRVTDTSGNGISFPKFGKYKKQVSIIEHAEQLAHERNLQREQELWGSSDHLPDLRRDSMRFY